jgi:hypothetical protein
MRSWMGVTMLVGILALAVGMGGDTARAADQGTQVQAADQPATYVCPMHPDMKATWQAKCPKCGMMMEKMKKEAGKPMAMMAMGEKKEGEEGAEPKAKMMAMMKGMKDMKGMMMRCKMMMDAKVQKTDPAGLLALKDELQLTDAQVMRLGEIAAAARRQADVVLTDEQRQKLAGMAGKAQSMAEMHQHMQQMMKEMMEKGDKGE